MLYDELRVFDPRQRDSLPNNIKKYPNLFTADEMEVLCASGEWKLYWKQRIVYDPPCNNRQQQWVWQIWAVKPSPSQ